MRPWVRAFSVGWVCMAGCSDGRDAPVPPAPTAPSVIVDTAEPQCGAQSFLDPQLFSQCPKPVARLCPLPPESDALAVYSAGSCYLRNGETCTPTPYPSCFAEHFSVHVSFVPPAEGLCGPEADLSLTNGTAQWRLQEFAPVEGQCRVVSTTDGERDLLPCCRTLVDLPLQQAPGFTLRLGFDRDWARR